MDLRVALTDGRRAGPRPSVVLAVCAAVLAPTLAYRVGVDQGSFAYIGNALLQGAWPYVRTWEGDYPGQMFLQAGQILVLGKSIAAFRLFDLLVQLANAYFIFRIAARVAGRAGPIVAAVLYCLIYQGYGPWNTGQREGFGLLFILAGYWAFFTADRRRPLVTAALIGLGLGLAFTFKPTLLAMMAFYLPLIPRLREPGALAVSATAGAAIAAPAAGIVAAYGAAGHLRDLYEACVAYQPIYTARLRGDAPLVAYWIDKLSRLGLNAVALGAGSAPFLFLGPARRERVMIWCGYAGSLFAVFVQGTFAGYHYLPGLALGAILVGSIIDIVCDWLFGDRTLAIGRRRISVSVAVAVLVLAAASAFYLRRAPYASLVTLQFLKPPAPQEFRNRTVFDYTESYDVAAYLRDRTRPGQPIQIWGYESLVYYLADRPAASRFQLTHPLVMRVPGGELTPMQQRWRAEFVRDIETRQPAYVAVVTGDNWWWAPDEKSSQQLLDEFPEWKRIIERDYTLEHTIGRFLIYRRQAAGGPASGRPAN